MTQTFPRERDEMLAAVRRTRLELAEAFGQASEAVADAQERMAETSEVEWLGRLLRAQACFTRSVGDATTKFHRDLVEET